MSLKESCIRTELNNDLPEIIRMSTPAEESFVTYSRSRVAAPEVVFLHICDRLHKQPNSKNDYARNIPACAKRMLRVLLDIRRVQDRDRERHGPNPDHLEDPESQEFEEVVSFIVESVIFAGFKNTEEKKPGEAEAP